MVTDEDFSKTTFKDFLKESNGFVFIQEGVHSGLLSNGKLLDAHYNVSPLYSPVFSCSDFITKFDNDNTLRDYQSAVLFVPKGTVNAFLAKYHSKLKEGTKLYQQELAKDSSNVKLKEK
jgi:hypothetical protein